MIRQLHQWNALGCLVLSFVLNSMLIWLILKRSPKEMKVYSRILLQTAVGDILLSLVLAITQPVFFVYGSEQQAVCCLVAPFVRNIDSTPLQFLLLQLVVLVFYFTVFGLCVQFVYRYLILIRNTTISLGHYFLLLCVPFSGILVSCFLLYLVGYPTPANERIDDGELSQMLSLGPNESIYAAMASNPGPARYVVSVVLLMISIFYYTVVAFCAYRMVKHVRTNLPSGQFGQSRLMDMNKQLTRSLILLAVMPLLLSLLNVFIDMSLLITNAQSSTDQTSATITAQMLSTLPVHWLPVANVVVYVLTVKPYFRAVVTLGKVHPSTTVGGVPPPNASTNQQI